jgi:DNA-binding CsgD family transcriptional regulator
MAGAFVARMCPGAKLHTLTHVLVELRQVLGERERQRRGLTEQETDLLQLVAAGLTTKHIATQQFCSERTIHRKMRQIYRKLGVKNRVQAVAEGSRLGLI